MEGQFFSNVADFENAAAKKISPQSFGFYAAGAGNITTKDNCDAFKRWRFRPRLLRNVSSVDTTTTVLGSEIPFPICIAPTAIHKRATYEGEVATAKAAEALGIGMCVSMFSNCSMEEIAYEAPKCLRWCHLQPIKNKAILMHLIRRAENNGYSGFIVTVDQAILGKRMYMTSDGSPFEFKSIYQSENIKPSIQPWLPSPEADPGDALENHLDGTGVWSDIDWIKNVTKLPVVVKGILTEEMALEAMEHGVDGIIVSNHGGRQLDGTFASIDALSEVVKTVDGKCDVYFDGGIRSGTDVAKAIALGAKVVFVGRPVLWGLAVDGANGAQKLLEMLRDEFTMTMQLLGVKSIKELQSASNMVVHETYLFSKL